MSSKPIDKRTKEYRDLIKGNEDTSPKTIDESFPYQVDQICADVKIVEIKPEVDRCIGFVYVKRDKQGKILSIPHQPKEGDTKLTYFHEWEGTVHWMMLSDFRSFIKAQLESGKFVSEGI